MEFSLFSLKVEKKMEQNYEVRRSSELGRYAVASRNLKGGDLILEELPFTHGPKVVFKKK